MRKIIHNPDADLDRRRRENHSGGMTSEPQLPTGPGSRGRVVGRDEMQARGRSKRKISELAKSGELHVLRPGRYLDGVSWGRLDDVQRHRLLVHDMVEREGSATGSGSAVVSHVSAAVLHGLPVPAEIDLRRVHLTWPGARGRPASTHIHPHRSQLDAADVTRIRPTDLTSTGLTSTGPTSPAIYVTTVARTLYDLATSLDQSLAVPVADAALRGGFCTPGAFPAIFERTAGRPRSYIARQVLLCANGRSMSFEQSRARVMMARAGLPDPEVSVPLHPRAGGEALLAHFRFPTLRSVAMVCSDLTRDRCEVARSVAAAGDSLALIEDLDLSEPDRLFRLMHETFTRAGHRGWRRSPSYLLPGAVLSIWDGSALLRREPDPSSVRAARPPRRPSGPADR